MTTAIRNSVPASACGILMKISSSICRRREGKFWSDIFAIPEPGVDEILERGERRRDYRSPRPELTDALYLIANAPVPH
jgi:hypothetical protein